MQTPLERNFDRVRRRIQEAAQRARRDPGSIELVAVTKSVPAEVAARVAPLCERNLAESRADSLSAKHAHLAGLGLSPRWHFVGHLQTNKVRRVVELADVIHSIDSARLLDSVDRAAAACARTIDVYLQVKFAGGDARSGVDPREMRALAERAATASHVRVLGLMTIAPYPVPDPAQAARAVFEETAALARELETDPTTRRAFVDGRVKTSMGMSGDFEVAIECGSDVVRIGSLLFEGVVREPRERESA